MFGYLLSGKNAKLVQKSYIGLTIAVSGIVPLKFVVDGGKGFYSRVPLMVCSIYKAS